MIRKVRAIADLVSVPSVDGRPTYMLTRINVPPTARGRGHGSALLRLVLAAADAEGAVVQLEVLPSGPLGRVALVRWYRRHGFIGHVLLTRHPLRASQTAEDSTPAVEPSEEAQ